MDSDKILLQMLLLFMAVENLLHMYTVYLQYIV